MSENGESESFLKSQWFIVATGLLVIGIALFIILWFFKTLFGSVWDAFNTLDKSVATAVVAGMFTILATTITVMVGRYYEEKRKQVELHRERKIEMYDAFISRLFIEFGSDEVSEKTDQNNEAEKLELAVFLRDHQRKFLLWSNPGVIRAFSEWQKALNGEPNAQSIIKMEKFFLAVRKDLGHSNWSIKQGDTVRYILRHTDFFLEQIKTNPNITLAELSKLEKEAGLK